MSRYALSPIVLFACSIMVVLASGCGGEVPKPTSPSATVPTTKTGPAEPAPVETVPVKDAKVDEPPFEVESGFTLLSLDQFDAFGAEPDTWKATEDGIVCTGKPRGYLYSKQPYQNFVLRLEYRFPRPKSLKEDAKFKGNTGFLVDISGEHKLWPICLEVQGKYVQMAAIKENGGAEPVVVEDDDAARQQARKAVGKWNALEIVSNSGALSVSLNGTPISSSKAGSLNEGLIGIQAEDHLFEVRRMRIRPE